MVGARDFSTIDFRLKPHAGRWESGSLNVAGISALGASLELLLEIGIPTISERILELTDHLCERLADKPHLEVFSSRLPGEKSSIVSVAFKDPADLSSKFRSLPGRGDHRQPPGGAVARQSALLQQYGGDRTIGRDAMNHETHETHEKKMFSSFFRVFRVFRGSVITPRSACITSAAFWPPKPKLVDTATRVAVSRAVFGT